VKHLFCLPFPSTGKQAPALLRLIVSTKQAVTQEETFHLDKCESKRNIQEQRLYCLINIAVRQLIALLRWLDFSVSPLDVTGFPSLNVYESFCAYIIKLFLNTKHYNFLSLKT
jgi:hypothetical protein